MSALWHTVNRFRYLYPTAVTGALTCLRVLPRVRHGAQYVLNTRLRIDPHPRRARSWTDRFGNCVVEVEHPSLSSHLEIEAEFCTTSQPSSPASHGHGSSPDGQPCSAPDAQRRPAPKGRQRLAPGGARRSDEGRLPSLRGAAETLRSDFPAGAGVAPPLPSEPYFPEDLPEARRLYLPLTRLVNRSAEIESLADDLRRRCATDEELAWECMRRVYHRMRYLPGSTGVATPAADALAGRVGVCQDFAQLMLAICRTAGVPARYVSGHLEGEGQMHAWVELLYASADSSLAWHPLDPTHDRAALDGYVTVAVGRDYADVSPISGHCYGPEPGRLSSHQHMRRVSAGADLG